jgi:peptidoglycan/LPS O-acetylase OafA/YrhL
METVPPRRLAWVEPLKALALVAIFLDHVAERLFGSPYFGNPDAHWPAFWERVGQLLTPPVSSGKWRFVLAALRDTAWLGDQGVSLFLVVSGLTLAWSCASSSEPGGISWSRFYQRRLLRIYPIWIAANLLMLFPFAIFGVHLSLLDPRLYLSLAGIRVLPDQLYYGNSAWWFVTLLLQLYLVFPLLWMALKRFGLVAFGIGVPLLALAIRGAGLLVFHDYLDAWSRGAIFITRLPEFAFGITFGVLLFRRRTLSARWKLLAIGIGSFVLGLASSFSLLGMTTAPAMQGCGAFLILYSVFSRVAATSGFSFADWIGRHSLSLFLVHQPFVRLLIPEWGASTRALPFAVRLLLVIALSVAAAVLLERITSAALRTLKLSAVRWGHIGLSVRLASAFLLVWLLLVCGELMVRHYAPLEAQDLGWGERSSLQPDPVFGWKLRPLEKTRLRWISYDYEIQSNSLGFPAPEYGRTVPPGVRRILVTGDAFTSAEGVDTATSWPRLLEKDLESTQVLDFAVTGYGPNQYQQIVERFTPLYHPGIVLIGLFINDYQDVMTTNAEFQKSIGFGRPDPNGLAAVLTFRQLSALVRQKLTKLVYDRILKRPDPDGYFLGQFEQLESGDDGNVEKGRAALAERLGQVKECANLAGARLLVVLIPSGPQVCQPESLRYWPKYTNLTDSKFDVTLPQRTTKAIAGKLGIQTIDLLPALRAMKTCPYQAENMHWTAAGHQMAAEYVARFLMQGSAGTN